MAKPYAQDLRERVIAGIAAGYTQSEIAERLSIGRRTIVAYVKRMRERGHVKPEKFGGHKQHKLASHAEKVKKFIAAEPDQTLAELKEKLAAEKIIVGVSSIDRFLKASGLAYKKNAVRGGTETRGRGRGARRLA